VQCSQLLINHVKEQVQQLSHLVFLFNVMKLLTIMILMSCVIHLRKDVLQMDLVVLQVYNVKMSKLKRHVKVKLPVDILEIVEIYKLNVVL